MKKAMYCLCILGIISFTYSCNSTQEKKAEEVTPVETPVTDSGSSIPPPGVTETPAVKESTPAETPVDESKYDLRSVNKQTAAVVKKALVETLLKNDLAVIDAAQRKFIMYEMDLNGDARKEIFVGFNGSYFCGSGGCNAYLLNDDGSLITTFTVTAYPIVVGPTATKGWLDLTINSGGAKHLIKWDGTKYPGNPSIEPKTTVTPASDMPHALDWEKNPYPWFSF